MRNRGSARRFSSLAVYLLSWVVIPCLPAANADEEPDLAPLVQLLSEVDDANFQLDLLKGMRSGLRGRKSMKMSQGWPTAYQKLSASKNAEVRDYARVLALTFGDETAIAQLKKIVSDTSANVTERTAALKVLIDFRVKGTFPLVVPLLDQTEMQSEAIRAMGAFADKSIPELLLTRYGKLSESHQQDIISSLSSRADFAIALLKAIESKQVDSKDVTAFAARQMQSLNNKEVTELLGSIWGTVRRTSQYKQKLIRKYKRILADEELKDAKASDGRLVFQKTCQKCHKLYGEGGKIGPDLTGSNRANLDYFLHNVVDPSAAIAKDYQMNIIILADGRILNGIIIEKSPTAVILQTANDKVTLSRDDIDEINRSPLSMMPDGQIEKMSDTEVKNLYAYLRTKTQVPLPADAQASDEPPQATE